MAKLFTAADAHIDAPADVVLAILRDFDGHHRRILPPAFSDFEVVHDRLGDGTMTQFKLTLGGRTTEGRTLATGHRPRRDPGAGPRARHGHRVPRRARGRRGRGSRSRRSGRRRLASAGCWSGSSRPRMLRKVYVQELELLAAYAPSVAGSPTGAGSGASLAVSSSR